MYGIFTYIWLIFMVNVLNIPYIGPMGIVVTMYFSCYISSPDEAIRKWFFHQAQLERSTEGPERTEAKTLVPSKVLGR